jgi:hypothetical protein
MRLVMNEGHEHRVYGRLVRAGEVFEAPDLEAKVWIQFGRARAASSRVATKVVETESKPLEEKEKQTNKRYHRRDMRVEDE